MNQSQQYCGCTTFLTGTSYWTCDAWLVSYVRQPSAEASTINRAQPTGCCMRLSSKDNTPKWRSSPVLIIGLIQEDRMEGQKRNRSRVRECAGHARSITKLRTPTMRRITKTGKKNSGELYPDFDVAPYVILPHVRNRRN